MPSNYWNKTIEMFDYIQWLEKKLEIKTLDDWYSISRIEILNYFKGGSMLNKYGGLKGFLCHYYPHYNWNFSLFENSCKFYPSKSQLTLIKILKNIFPNEHIEINYKHPSILFNKIII